MRKTAFLSAVVTASLALAMLGCSADDATQDAQMNDPVSGENVESVERMDLQVAESGYYVDEYGTAHYAAIVENPNQDWAAQMVQVSVVSRDDDGNIIGTTSNDVTLLFANGRTAICGTTADTQPPASLEFNVSVSDSSWVQEDMTQDEYSSAFPIDGVNMTSDEYGRTVFAAQVTNNAGTKYSFMNANIVLRDKDGSIVGGINDLLTPTELNEGDTLAFSVDGFDLPEFDSYDIYMDYGYPDMSNMNQQ